jgi:integrase
MAKVLTAKSVEGAKPGASRREIPDAGLPGLYLVVQTSGAKSWALRYRVGPKQTTRKLTLGRYPAVGLSDARREAQSAARQVELGEDPAAAKQAQKAAAAIAENDARDKVKTLVDQFDRRHLSKIRSGPHVRRFLDRFVLPAWGDRDIHEISKRDVLDLLDGIVDGGTPVTANRVLAAVRKFCNWLVERDVIERSPATGVKPPTKEKSRDRVLSDDEIRWLWKGTEVEGQPFGPMARMLLLTGQRLGEVVGMTEREIAGDNWHLPATRTKNARAHDVPLSEAAQAVLAGVKRISGSKRYIFTTNGEAPVSGFDRAATRLRSRVEKIAAEERGEPVTVPLWTFHDMRRTCASGMARLGIPVAVTEAVLNHVSGSTSGIVAVYQRHDYASEKRAALEAWARYVLALVAERPADNVVRLNA